MPAVSRHRAPVGLRTAGRTLLDRPATVELVGLSARPADHYTRLWPSRPDQPSDAPLFLACMLPARLAAHALLWVTSTPGRLAVLFAAASALAALLLL
jgi:hypothetical protein